MVENGRLTVAEDKKRNLKIQKISVVDQVCDHIKQGIIEGKWMEGEKLPSEGNFAEMYGVNRLSVRMALQKLNTLGLIETRVGDGSYVKKFSMLPYMHEIGSLYAGQDREEDIKRFRSLIEADSLRLAVLNASQTEIEELKKRLDHYYALTQNYVEDPNNLEKLDQLVNSDLEFHNQIIKMSHNKVYEDIYGMVGMAIKDHIKNLLSSRIHSRIQDGLPTRTPNDTHIKMYEIILKRDSSKADEIVYELLNSLPDIDYKNN
jgi:GntR family transcriptional repressor for pyruvate dehydrogenase complex